MAGFRNSFQDDRRISEQLLELQVALSKTEQAPCWLRPVALYSVEGYW
jgi:hypothetical protein